MVFDIFTKKGLYIRLTCNLLLERKEKIKDINEKLIILIEDLKKNL